MYCPVCGKLVEEGAQVCPFCATPLETATEIESLESIDNAFSSDNAVENEAVEAVEETAEAAEEVTEEVAEETSEAVEETAEEAADTAEEVADTAEAADDAVEEATEEAADVAEETAEDAPDEFDAAAAVLDGVSSETEAEQPEAGKKKKKKKKGAKVAIAILSVFVVLLIAAVATLSIQMFAPESAAATAITSVERKVIKKFKKRAPADNTVLLTIGEEKVTKPTFLFFYNYAMQTEQYYASYGYSNFNTNTPPTQQQYSDTQTYDDYFAEYALKNIQSLYVYYNEATAAGYTISEDEKAEIEQTITQYDEYALQYGCEDADELLDMYYGSGVTVDLFREISTKSAVAAKYLSDKQKEFEGAITADALKAEFEKNRKNYTKASVLIYSAYYEEGEDKAALLKEVKAEYAKITDKASFISTVCAYDDTMKEDDLLSDKTTYDDLSYFAEKGVADYAFAAERKVGDFTLVEGERGVYLVYIVSTAAETYPVTVRYCLVPYNDEKTSAADDTEVQAAKKEAEKYFKEWKDGTADEKSFGEIAKKYSKDDSTSADGGLITFSTGEMVSAFEGWCYDAARKPGDCEIVEAKEYGFFLIYFDKLDTDNPDWHEDAKKNLSQKEIEKLDEKLYALDKYTMTTNDGEIDAARLEINSVVLGQ